MFLSRVKPAPGFIVSQLANKANLGDAYAQHQLLWQFFPEKSERDFLFRYEQSRQGAIYYVLSSTAPQRGLKEVELATKPFIPKLQAGDCLGYSLRANPTKVLKPESRGERGKRVDVMMHAKYLARQAGAPVDEIASRQIQAARDWLLDPRRQERLGIEFVGSPEVTEHVQHQVCKRATRGREGQSIMFSSVNYAGLLRVIDPEQFLLGIKKGVGRAKSMGCGLMLLRRAG